jgi:Leucine-rich repeat (LRR) protein
MDVSRNISLIIFYCHNNQLTNLDVTKNTALKQLYCDENQLTSLDVSKNTALQILYCGNNQLTSLDVTQQSDLRVLSCGGNQMTSLDISNNSKLGNWALIFVCDLEINNMPTLEKVCVWTMPFPTEDLRFCRLEGSPNVYFTTDCSK